MNRKQDDDHNQRDHDAFEDRALDSELCELGRAEKGGAEFADRVMARIEDASARESSETFFGRPSLSESVKRSASKSTVAQASSSKARLKSTRINKSTARSRVFVVAASLAAIVLLVGLWFTFGSADSGFSSVENADSKTIPIDDSVISKPDPKKLESNDSIDLRPLTIEPPPEPSLVENVSQPDEPNLANESVLPLDFLDSEMPKPTTNVFDSRIDPRWVLTFEFNERGGGATINERELDSRISIGNLDFVLKQIEYSLVRRVCYLAPALDGRWAGAIRIKSLKADETRHFGSLEEMQDAFGKAHRFARRLLPKHSSVNLRNADLFVSEALTATDSILLEAVTSGFTRDELLFRGIGPNPNPPRFKNYRTINLQELLASLDAGTIQFPNPSEQFVASTIVQDRASDDLRNELDATVPSIDMFENIDQFRQAEVKIGGATERGRFRVKVRHVDEDIAKLVKQRDQSKDPEQVEAIQVEIGKLARKSKVLRKQMRMAASGNGKELSPVEPLVQVLPSRPDLQSLSLVMGDECHLDEDNAKTMSNVSFSLGRALARFDSFGSRDFAQHDEKRFAMVKYLIGVTAHAANPEQGLSTLDQMLQMERPEIRLELVNVLRENGSSTALGLLACYAKYDLESSVRMAAVDALRDFPPKEYRPSLLDGFTYPWPEVAKHSAEALVRLHDTGSIPGLVELLNLPDPRTPERMEHGNYVQRELVGINHMRNCTLCHADSQDKSDLGRGLIPIWDKELSRDYYKSVEGPMVRADVTYLRQDFSVIQKVKDAAPWPEFQRFDYVVRAKSLTEKEFNSELEKYEQRPNEYHAAVAKALRMLTGENPGDDTYQTWKAIAGN